jgi:hypothetical protein
MSPAARRLRYDVFLSYSHRDKDWVRQWLVPQLRSAALRVCIDHESFEPGAPSITEMERAVLQSRKTVLVLTPAYLLSEWAELENILVQTLDPANRQRRLVPVLYTPCELPLRLRALTFVDLTRADEHTAQVDRLVEAIRRRLTTSRRRQAVTAVSLPFEVPTGALSPDSPLYIERDPDDLVRQQVIREGSTTIAATPIWLSRRFTRWRLVHIICRTCCIWTTPTPDHLPIICSTTSVCLSPNRRCARACETSSGMAGAPTMGCFCGYERLA